MSWDQTPTAGYMHQNSNLRRRLPELWRMEELVKKARNLGRVALEGEVTSRGLTLPLYSFAFGAEGSNYPTLAFIGGVHGLERIGTNVILSYLGSVCELLQWDVGLQYLLRRCRLFFLPLVNPVGMYARTRCNGNGVDLMRNAPVEAEEKPNLILVGGHRISPLLPWYRGKLKLGLEREAETLVRFIQSKVMADRFTMTLDVHSGFGAVDRVWFPYAKSRRPFEDIAQAHALKGCLDRSLPNHVYRIEPQSNQYVTHGDLWDYLYLKHKQKEKGLFLPLCLEMGSWLWVKKNPRQIFSSDGIFNPILPHRFQRTLRRHASLMDFLVRLTASYENWVCHDENERHHYQQALALWYPKASIHA